MKREDFRKCCKSAEGFTVDDKFLEKLNVAEDLAGFKFVVTSGFRCATCNRMTPGADPNSRHLRGEAVDVFAEGAHMRGQIIEACLAAGIKSMTFSKERKMMHISNGSWLWISAYGY